jgi:hypothetical protein
MVIGLSPEYNYPGTLEKWRTNNTFYASNYGACLISRAIMRLFDADYISNFSDIGELKEKYDTCVLAFSTHVHEHRNVTLYADIVEKLNMKTIILSLGIQDQITSQNEIPHVHSSMLRLLHLVSERSSLMGVRGPHTAAVLKKLGFNNVCPVGCPTLFWEGHDSLYIEKKPNLKNSIFVYHQTAAAYASSLMKATTILGQDFLDQAVFTNDLCDDHELVSIQKGVYAKYENTTEISRLIKENGCFPTSFEQWFRLIKQNNFIFGPRLHGCIAALINRIPALLFSRDLRGREIAEYYDIPSITYDKIQNKTIQDLFEMTDYSRFNVKFKDRYKSYYDFLTVNQLTHTLEAPQEAGCETVVS